MTDAGPTGDGRANREVALRHVGNNESTLATVIDLFEVECPRLLTAIRDAIENGASVELERAAHTLKGSAEILAGTNVADVALQIELLGRSKQLDGTAALLVKLQRHADEMLRTIREWQ